MNLYRLIILFAKDDLHFWLINNIYEDSYLKGTGIRVSLKCVIGFHILLPRRTVCKEL